MIDGEIALRCGVHQIGGAHAFPAHAHVERSVVAEREAALRLVELHRRDAEIEQDAVDRLMPEPARDVIEIREAVFGECQAPGGLFDQRIARSDRIPIAIDPDHARAFDVENERAYARPRRTCRRW